MTSDSSNAIEQRQIRIVGIVTALTLAAVFVLIGLWFWKEYVTKGRVYLGEKAEVS